MPVLYEPKGRAFEYADLAVNLYRGCIHGCEYCFAPSVLRMDRGEFHQVGAPRKGVLEQLERDTAKLAGDQRNVLLCFTTDPYQPADDVHRLTREAIRILNAGGLGVTVLTKGGLRAVRDFDLLAKDPRNCFASTLTLDDPADSLRWEPEGAPPAERLEALQIAHHLGIATWVSLEPVLDPEVVYRLIRITAPFVDLYKVGTLNYHPHAATINWSEFRAQVVDLLKTLGKPYYLKRDLLEK